VLILVDSIGKYSTEIRDAEILSYKGETIGEFIHKIRYNIIKLNRYTHVIVLVGTNNVLNNKPVEILSLYSTLIHLIKQKYKNIIVGISSILPRPKDQIVITLHITISLIKTGNLVEIRLPKTFSYQEMSSEV
jgi:hypothetical protein